MATLTGTTVVADAYGMPVLLREGDPLPEWAVGKVGAHLLTQESGPASQEPVEVQAPPKAGPGSGKAAWVAYAERIGVDVDPDDSRDEIIAAVESLEG